MSPNQHDTCINCRCHVCLTPTDIDRQTGDLVSILVFNLLFIHVIHLILTGVKL